jgi:uncharacterized protein (TIGR02598 family)
MKHRSRATAAFSLVEVVLAIGVAAFCLLTVLGLLAAGLKTQQASMQQTTANRIMATIFGDLRADVRLPPGQQAKSQEGVMGLGLHGHWANVATPDTLYFTNEGKKTGSANAGSPPADAVFRAKVTYFFPPSQSTSACSIIISWPAAVDPTTGTPAGKVQTFFAVNR